MLTNLFWTERATNGSWTLQAGQLDVTDFVDVYGLVSPYTAFQNLAFNTNPTINAPNPGLGIAGGTRLGKNFYVVGSLADANPDYLAEWDYTKNTNVSPDTVTVKSGMKVWWLCPVHE